MKPYLTLLALGLFAAPVVQAQQWYNQNLSYYPGNAYARIHGASFTANGKAYYGWGEDVNGQLSPELYVYDPVANSSANVNNGWSGRSHLSAFAVGNYGYFGLGNLGFGGPVYVSGIYQKFDLTTQQIVGIVPFPGGPRLDAVTFVLGNKAYVGGGVDVDTTMGTSTNSNDLWEYDPITDLWAPRASMPASIAKAVSFAINGKAYVLAEGSTTFWEYDPLANAWATRAPYLGTPLVGRCAFAANGSGYVGCGTSGGTDYQTFFAYDPIADAWTPAPAMWDASGRHSSLTFSIGSDGYLLGGRRGFSNTILADLWRLGATTNPAPSSWTQRPFMPASGREHPIAFSIGSKGYIGGGKNGTINYTDFWEYDPATMTWTPKAAIPANTDVGFSLGNMGYVTTTSATQNFFAYDQVANAWSARADLPGGARSSAACFAMEGLGYVCTGLIGGIRQSDLWAYNPGTDTWTQRANSSAVHGAAGFAIGNKGYCVTGNEFGSSTMSDYMREYDPVTNTWTGVVALWARRQNAQAFSIGNTAYTSGGIMGGPTYVNTFYQYDPITETWALGPVSGGGYRFNGAGFSIGGKGYVFGGRRNPDSGFLSGFFLSNDLWEYNPSIVNVAPRVFLEGCFVQGTGTMHDSLRLAGLLNTLDPYGANGYPYPGGNYSDRPVQVPTTTGNDAVVDRVVVELREPTAPHTVKASRSLWLQRDGDVVDMDGVSVPRFTAAPGTYQIAVRHRNHLGAMTTAGYALSSTPTVVDLTLAGTATYGTNARNTIGAYMVLWAGDVTFNGQLKYTGQANDRDPILVRIGGIDPLNTLAGYFAEDVNMNGVVKYTGANNDRDPILVNLGGMVLGTRSAQLP